MDSTDSAANPLPHNPLQPIFELMEGGNPDAICKKYNISRAEFDQRVRAYLQTYGQKAAADHLTTAKTGRNEPCPCGSGKKYKKCCLVKHEEIRKNMPADQLLEIEDRQRRKDGLEKSVQQGFDLLFAQDFSKAQSLAQRLLETYPEDDRLYDMLVMVHMAAADYDRAMDICEHRLQVAQEEKEFFLEHGYHKREGIEKKELVHFYSPSAWLEKLWVAQCAQNHRKNYPLDTDPELAALAENLKTANDMKRFPARQEEGYELRKRALTPVLDQLQAAGDRAIPYLLPLTYSLSWASIFIPDLLAAYGTERSLRLLTEFAMFRFPFFAQKCLSNLERFNEYAVTVIARALHENPEFDELKVGLIEVLGNIRTSSSFDLLVALTTHQSPYVVSWAADALGRHQNPAALPYLESAKERLGAFSKIAGELQSLIDSQKS